MIFFLVLGLAIIFLSLWDYKKAFLWFLLYKLFLVSNITVVSVPGIPLLSLDLLLTMVFLFLYFLKWRSFQSIAESQPFPYLKPFIFVTATSLLSVIFSVAGFTSEISAWLKDAVLNFGMAWLIWKLIDRNDLPFLFKGLTLMFFCSCIYCFYERSIQSNPLMEYELTLVEDQSRAIDFTYAITQDRGYRAQSYFEHAIGAGINWAMFIVFYFGLTLNLRARFSGCANSFALITALMCLPCLLFTSSRGPIFFFMIAVLALINLRSNRMFGILAGVVVIGVIMWPFISQYANNIASIFDSKAQAKVGGSNAEMRFEQLGAAVELMLQSPIVGLGYKFRNIIDSHLNDMLLGMESMWFASLTQFGILGTIARVWLAIVSCVVVPLKYKSKVVLFVSLAYWITGSLTSVPGISMHLYYIIIVLFIKCSDVYRQKAKTAEESQQEEEESTLELASSNLCETT